MRRKINFPLFMLLNVLPMPSRHFLGRMLRLWKAGLAKQLFGHCDKTCNIRPKVVLRYTENIYLGRKSSIGDKSRLVAREKIFIGEDVLMAPEVTILTENHVADSTQKLIESGTIAEPVTIGNDVWLGTRVTILPGANIPDGCVVAAGAVVSKRTFPPYSVIGGIPAHVIKEHRGG